MSRRRKRNPFLEEGAAWQEYVEMKYGVTLRRHSAEVELSRLIGTQSEIEAIKLELVRDESFRLDEPIAVYHGRMGKYYVVDGHTRARVQHDAGAPTISAVLLTSSETSIDLELAESALRSGGGRELHVGEIPIADRLGKGSPAWKKRRAELHRKIGRDPERS